MTAGIDESGEWPQQSVPTPRSRRHPTPETPRSTRRWRGSTTVPSPGPSTSRPRPARRRTERCRTGWPTSAVTDPDHRGPHDGTARLDAELVRRGLVRSRAQARELVTRGAVLVDGATATKPSTPVSAANAIVLAEEPDRWVGRAAYKLLEAFGCSGRPASRSSASAASTSGRAPAGSPRCCSSAGAAHVTALDVGHDQLVPEVGRATRGSTSAPGTNIRDVRPRRPRSAASTSSSPTSASSRCGWSSPSSPRVMTPTADACSWSSRSSRSGGSGWPGPASSRRPTSTERVLVDVLEAARTAGLHPRGARRQPHPGHDGNREFLLWLRTRPGEPLDERSVAAVVTAEAPSWKEHRDAPDPARGPPDPTRGVDIARGVVKRLRAAGIEVALAPDEARMFGAIDIGPVVEADPDDPTEGCELVVVLGGDGTILRGAEHSPRNRRAPARGQPRPRRLPRRGRARGPRRDGRAHRQPRLRGRGADDART